MIPARQISTEVKTLRPRCGEPKRTSQGRPIFTLRCHVFDHFLRSVAYVFDRFRPRFLDRFVDSNIVNVKNVLQNGKKIFRARQSARLVRTTVYDLIQA
jgi:hypothetical protein